MESLQRELERIYSLNVRLISRLLMKSVKEENGHALAASLWRAARGAGRLAAAHIRVKEYLGYCSIYYINIHILYNKVVDLYASIGAQSWWGGRLACKTRYMSSSNMCKC